MKFSKQQLMEAAEQIAANYIYPHPNHEQAEKKVTKKFFKALVYIARHMDQDIGHSQIFIHRKNKALSSTISNLNTCNYIFPDTFKLIIHEEKFVQHRTNMDHLFYQCEEYSEEQSEEYSEENLDPITEHSIPLITTENTPSEIFFRQAETPAPQFSCIPLPIPPKAPPPMCIPLTNQLRTFFIERENNFMLFTPKHASPQKERIQKQVSPFLMFLEKPSLREKYCMNSYSSEDSSSQSPTNFT